MARRMLGTLAGVALMAALAVALLVVPLGLVSAGIPPLVVVGGIIALGLGLAAAGGQGR